MKEIAAAIVLAAGSGTRMNTAVPKQFLELAGKPVIIHTLEKFEKSSFISDTVVVCHEDHIEDLRRLISKNKLRKVYKVVPGGETRQGSSFIGVKNCPPGTTFALIHDAVRPFINDTIISDTLEAAGAAGAAGTVVDMIDTVIVKNGDFIRDMPDRNNLKRAQTPQGFRYETILTAHEWALKNDIFDSTDDCGLVLAMGSPVKAVEGSVFNIKITDRADLAVAERLILEIE
ncbi:MAG: 2-C-methyl-D-erythritol 4-phosphate cytidylyltransferase [Candidatus Omnitrophica bacterium]|nr:2-C-methyl-D-erythritol 4-phosphate cytidylyltransferase [Candidatus Omnitrophota bacterium]